MTNKTAFHLLFVTSLLQAPHVSAEIYYCKDSQGHTITSDRPMPECKDRTTYVYSESGTMKKQFSSALTPEQQKAAELQEQQRTKEESERVALKKEQRYLTAHYPKEIDVELARNKALSEIKDKIGIETRLIEVTTEELVRNQNEQKLIPKNEIGRMIDAKNKEFSLTQTIQQSTALIKQYSAEETKLNRQFDDIHKHYVEVVMQNKNN